MQLDHTTGSTPLSTVALHWLSLGIAPIPVVPQTKRAAVNWRYFQTHLPSLADVSRWWRLGSALQLAVVCGWKGLVIFDFDALEPFHEWRAACPIETYTVSTARGYHCYFFADVARSFDHPLCEVRGPGRYVLAPPSRHPSGVEYMPFNAAPIVHVHSLSEVLPAVGIGDRSPHSIPGSLQSTLAFSRAAEIKARLNILDLARTVVDLSPGDRVGRWWSACCPFHNDRHPSFWIDAERQRFGCHAPNCRAHRSGDVIDFWALLHNVTVADAIWMLAG